MADHLKESAEGLTEGESFAGNEPFALFSEWFSQAQKEEPNDPNAMALASVDDEGLPNVRIVLLKEVTPQGFVFYTNLESEKGRELALNPKAALVFYWKSLRKQVRARGLIERVSEAEADAYFATRPKQAQIGAWASAQSRELEGRFALEAAVAKTAARYALSAVPRPPHWGGFRLKPLAIEFWRNRAFRLHDRVLFTRASLDSSWEKRRLYP